MSEITNFPRESTMREVANALNIIAIAQAENIGNNYSYKSIQNLLGKGLGPKAFPVGSRLILPHAVYNDAYWDVIGHDIYPDATGKSNHTMTIHMRDCIYERQVDAQEYFWANSSGGPLPAGTYNFVLLRADYGGDTREDGVYQFTTAQAIPDGGGFRHANIGVSRSTSAEFKPENIVGNRITSYDAAGSMIESSLTVSAGSDGTALGTGSRNQVDTTDIVGRFNSSQRNAYGNNNYGESASRQWLNSLLAANLWWIKMTPFDRAPSYTSAPGFLGGFDDEFIDMIVPVDLTTIRNTIYEEGGVRGGSYTTRDKVFPLSMTEFGFGKNNDISEGVVMPFWDGASAIDRIKYDISASTTARRHFMRSPTPSTAYCVRGVATGGALHNGSALSGYAQAPACTIGDRISAPIGA